MSTTSTPESRLPRTETNDPSIDQQGQQQGVDPQSQPDPNVVAGIETLLKIPAKVIGKAKSQHPGQPCHVTLELALANGPQQISVTMGSNDDAGMFRDTVAYRARKPGQQGLVAPGTLDNYGRDMSPSPDMAQMERIHNDPQRVYVLVVDADYLDDYDKEFQNRYAFQQGSGSERYGKSRPDQFGTLDEYHDGSPRRGTYDQGSHQVPGATEYARDDAKVATPSTPSTPTTTAPNASQPGGTAPGVQAAGASPGATSPAPNTPADIRNPRYTPTAPSPVPGALTPEEKNYKDQADLRKKQEEDNQRQNKQ